MRPKRGLFQPPQTRCIAAPHTARKPYVAPDIEALGRIHSTVLGISGPQGESGTEETHHVPVEGNPFGPHG